MRRPVEAEAAFARHQRGGCGNQRRRGDGFSVVAGKGRGATAARGKQAAAAKREQGQSHSWNQVHLVPRSGAWRCEARDGGRMSGGQAGIAASWRRKKRRVGKEGRSRGWAEHEKKKREEREHG